MKLIVLLVFLLLPGCIAYDIRDDVRSTRGTVGRMEQTVAAVEQTNVLLLDMERQLDRTNALLEDVNASLSKTNDSLALVSQRLEVLGPMQVSIEHLDEHLKSLRGTLDAIDGMLPFMSLSGGSGAATDPNAPAATPNTPAMETPLALHAVVAMRERIALAPNAVIVAQLINPSAPDVSLQMSTTPTAGKQLPFKVSIPMPAALDSSVPYIIRARVEIDGVARYTGEAALPGDRSEAAKILLKATPPTP